MQPIHSRMPVILDEEAESVWLSQQPSVPDLLGILASPPTRKLQAYEVSKLVNKASYDDPVVIEEVGSAA